MTLLVVLLIASSIVGLTFSQRGQLWADRSTQLEAELAQANSALETSREDLASARSTLARSEADVAALETRLGELANEKAQAQDDAASANLSATYLYELTQAATATTAQMDVCIQYQDSWSEVLVNIANGYTYNRSELNEFINDMTSTCAKARTMAAYLQDALDAL
jgi:chromosome segregation ATPase